MIAVQAAMLRSGLLRKSLHRAQSSSRLCAAAMPPSKTATITAAVTHRMSRSTDHLAKPLDHDTHNGRRNGHAVAGDSLVVGRMARSFHPFRVDERRIDIHL